MPKKGEKATESQMEALNKHQKRIVKGDPRMADLQAKAASARKKKRLDQIDRVTFAQHLAEALGIVKSDGNVRKYKIAEGLVQMLEDELGKENPNGMVVNTLFSTIRDTIGEKPKEAVKLSQEAPFEITVTVVKD